MNLCSVLWPDVLLEYFLDELVTELRVQDVLPCSSLKGVAPALLEWVSLCSLLLGNMLHFSIFVPHKYLSILEFEAMTFSLDQNME